MSILTCEANHPNSKKLKMFCEKTDSESQFEKQVEKLAENEKIVADETKESGEKREHDDIDASEKNVLEKTIQDLALKKQKIAVASAASNEEKKRDRDRSRKNETLRSKKLASSVCALIVNDEKEERDRLSTTVYS